MAARRGGGIYDLASLLAGGTWGRAFRAWKEGDFELSARPGEADSLTPGAIGLSPAVQTMTFPGGPMIICYDGSEKALEALDYAAELFPDTSALVVTVWKPITEELLATAGSTPPISDPADANQRQRRAAWELAREGTGRASGEGLAADALVVEAIGPIWEAIEEAAHERDARLIVCGTDRSGLRMALPGSVANALFQNSSRPVLVKPSSTAAAARRREFTSRKVMPRRRHAEHASHTTPSPRTN